MVTGYKKDTDEFVSMFVLSTCGKTAHDEFSSKFPDFQILNGQQTAQTNITKEEAVGRDFWKEKLNWTVRLERSKPSPEQIRYFKMKETAEKVQAAKKKIGITSWDTATDKQLEDFNRELASVEKIG